MTEVAENPLLAGLSMRRTGEPCAVVIFGAAARRWLLVLSGKVAPTPDLAEASPAA